MFLKFIFQKNFFKITYFKCLPSENLCDELLCSIKPVSRTHRRLSAYCHLVKPIPEMIVRAVIEMKNSKNIYMAWVNQTVDYCAELGKGNIDFLGVIEQILNKMDPNLVPPCPIQVFKFVSLLAFYRYIFSELLGSC